MTLLGGVVAWIISIIAFIIAVDYICSRIDDVGAKLETVRGELGSLATKIESSRDDFTGRELEEIHKTLRGGLVALIAIGARAHSVDLEKLHSEEFLQPACEMLSVFSSDAEWRERTTRARCDGVSQGQPERGESQP